MSFSPIHAAGSQNLGTALLSKWLLKILVHGLDPSGDWTHALVSRVAYQGFVSVNMPSYGDCMSLFVVVVTKNKRCLM